ncbi:MAG: BBP7 family outer membrane beta-barrel protein [Pirellulaceae bacterium]|nr:BBP7 family outer membrane beta-barrel protein [Pirellulaceae bacterium]
MKTVRLIGLLVLVVVAATTAHAQYTLYGAPDVLRLPASQNQPAVQSTWTEAQGATAYPAYGRAVQPTPEPVSPVPRAQVGDPPARTPNLMTEMLGESRQPQLSGADVCGEQSCAASCVATACEPPCSPWFASAGWLVLGRDKANRVWTSYDSGDEADQLTNTNDIELDWGNGGEIRFGRRFCGGCNPWAIEGVYWTTKPFDGFLSTTNPEDPFLVSTPLRVSEIEFDGVNGVDLFDDAIEHRLWRRNEFHNIEINIVGGDFLRNCAPHWNVQWLVGARYLRFDENLVFGSLRQGEWGGSGGEYEAYLGERIKNDLVGFQVGFDARGSHWHNLQLYLAPKIGIYNNHVENTFSLYRGDGVVANPTAASGVVGTYPVRSSDNFFSVLTEIDLGLYWHITERWSAKIGYRVVAVTGMGLADHQIPTYVVDIPEIAAIDHNGNLLLHGAFVGLTYNY